jgi:hypothetical protein
VAAALEKFVLIWGMGEWGNSTKTPTP